MSYELHTHDGFECPVDEHPSCFDMLGHIDCTGEGNEVPHDCTHEGETLMEGSLKVILTGAQAAVIKPDSVPSPPAHGPHAHPTKRHLVLGDPTPRQLTDARLLKEIHTPADIKGILEIEAFLKTHPPEGAPVAVRGSRSLIQTHIHDGTSCEATGTSAAKGCRITSGFISCKPLEGGPAGLFRCAKVVEPHSADERTRILKAIKDFKIRHGVP
jgi:hypothetical protein